MKKAEIFKRMRIDVLDNNTVFIQGKEFNFAYTVADKYVKEEYKGMYEYFGWLQSNFNNESPEHLQLEKWLC